jgi:hypothetical protein
MVMAADESRAEPIVITLRQPSSAARGGAKSSGC